jgi:catalase (peroxidase I)
MITHTTFPQISVLGVVTLKVEEVTADPFVELKDMDTVYRPSDFGLVKLK